MIRATLISFVLLLLSSCADERPAQKVLAYVQEEITAREQALQELKKKGDTLLPDLKAIASRINELMLLSKDIENLSACVNLSNSYFKQVADSFALDQENFMKIEGAMHVDEIALVLKQNHLSFLNQLIMKRGGADGKMFTAH